MPNYDYYCGSCGNVFEVSHGMRGAPAVECAECGLPAKRLLSAPNLKLGNWSSPSAAKYARTTRAEEIARERELQKGYQVVWLPGAVKHNPWNDKAE